jgi:hypothetical protein
LQKVVNKIGIVFLNLYRLTAQMMTTLNLRPFSSVVFNGNPPAQSGLFNRSFQGLSDSDRHPDCQQRRQPIHVGFDVRKGPIAILFRPRSPKRGTTSASPRSDRIAALSRNGAMGQKETISAVTPEPRGHAP